MIYSNEQIEKTRNLKKPDKRVYTSRRINNYRELAFYSIEHYSDHVAYKYKNKPTDKEIIKKTYADCGKDMKAFGTAMLNRKAERIAVIGKNRFVWINLMIALWNTGTILWTKAKSKLMLETKNMMKLL